MRRTKRTHDQLAEAIWNAKKEKERLTSRLRELNLELNDLILEALVIEWEERKCQAVSKQQ